MTGSETPKHSGTAGLVVATRGVLRASYLAALVALAALVPAGSMGCALETGDDGEVELVGSAAAELGVEDDVPPPDVVDPADVQAGGTELPGSAVLSGGDPLDPHPDPWKLNGASVSSGADEGDSGESPGPGPSRPGR